jgi:transposase
MKKQRRQFDKSFKEMAVELCLSGKTTSEVATDLGIRMELVRRWKKAYLEHGKNSFPGNGLPVQTEEQKEITRLKKALNDAQIERDILKKAVAIFSKTDDRSTGS